MHKIVSILIGERVFETAYSINEIISDEEVVVLPDRKERGGAITMIGFEQNEDTRSEYERWYDAYYYSYYPSKYAVATEVVISENIKKIVIPHTVTDISCTAFKNVKDIIFEIDEKNESYKIQDNKIIEISSGKVIWPCDE